MPSSESAIIKIIKLSLEIKSKKASLTKHRSTETCSESHLLISLSCQRNIGECIADAISPSQNWQTHHRVRHVGNYADRRHDTHNFLCDIINHQNWSSKASGSKSNVPFWRTIVARCYKNCNDKSHWNCEHDEPHWNDPHNFCAWLIDGEKKDLWKNDDVNHIEQFWPSVHILAVVYDGNYEG